MERFENGSPVWLFYRMSGLAPEEQFLVCPERRAGARRPRIGLSEGWVPARVQTDFDPVLHDPGDPRTRVAVRHDGTHRYDRHGVAAPAGGPASIDHRVAPAHVVPRRGESGLLSRPEPAPTLGLVVVRWGGHPVVSAPEWGSTGNGSSDTYIGAFIEHGIVDGLGMDGDFEIWTVFVEDASDLEVLASSAHLTFGATHPIRRCRHLGVAFFIYPTPHDPRFPGDLESDAGEAAGYLNRHACMRATEAFERAGIPVVHPHCASLTELLVGKSWQHTNCLDPALRVPAALAVPRGDVEADLPGTARRCLAGLEVVRRAQHRRGLTPVGMDDVAGEPRYAVDEGVLKLGYSWEAQDVRHWRGLAGLEEALRTATRDVRSGDRLVGQSHDCSQFIVQEFVPNDCEMRCYHVEGVCEVILGTRMRTINDAGDFGDLVCCSLGETKYRFFAGDAAAFEDAVRQCVALSRHWLDWLVIENGGRLPPAIRFDMLVRRMSSGAVDVRSLEICEQGFSWLGDETLAPRVFAAIARGCVTQGVTFAPHQIPGGADESEAEGAGPRAVDVGCPSVRATIRTCLVDDGLIAFDTGNGNINHLNATAGAMLTLCDGRTEVAAIEATVREALPGAAPGGAEDVDLGGWFVDAVDKGLIGFGRPEAPGGAEMSARNLADVAARLRGPAASRRALHCMRRATELEPEAPGYWCALGDLARTEGESAEATAAYRRYLGLVPDDRGIDELVLALDGRLRLPPVAEALTAALSSVLLEGRRTLDVLDVGCLAGEALGGWSKRLEGVASAPGAIGRTGAPGVHDVVHEAEPGNWMENAPRRYDLVVSCDGIAPIREHLADALAVAARAVSTPGWLALAVDGRDAARPDPWPTQTRPRGIPGLGGAASAAGLDVALLAEQAVVTPSGAPTLAWILVLRRGAAAAPGSEESTG